MDTPAGSRCWTGQEITYIHPGKDVAGLAWVGFQLAPQTVDGHPEQVVMTTLCFSPRLLEQEILRHNPPCMLR